MRNGYDQDYNSIQHYHFEASNMVNASLTCYKWHLYFVDFATDSYHFSFILCCSHFAATSTVQELRLLYSEPCLLRKRRDVISIAYAWWLYFRTFKFSLTELLLSHK